MVEQYAIAPFVAVAEWSPSATAEERKKLSEQAREQLLRFLYPLIQELHATVDIRPLRTLVQTVEAIVAFRDSAHGLLLSELGSYWPISVFLTEKEK